MIPPLFQLLVAVFSIAYYTIWRSAAKLRTKLRTKNAESRYIFIKSLVKILGPLSKSVTHKCSYCLPRRPGTVSLVYISCRIMARFYYRCLPLRRDIDPCSDSVAMTAVDRYCTIVINLLYCIIDIGRVIL